MIKILKGMVATAIMMAPMTMVMAQKSTIVYDNREEFVHLDRMSNGNLLVSGKLHELGNKSDLVMLLGPQGEELRKKVLCPTCPAAVNYYSRETLVGDVIHVRSNGDIYTSDLDLEESELLYNIAENRFESIETYQVLEHLNFIIVVSYAVENSVRGLLHTTIDTRSKVIFSQKFNVEFPDIAGSIGIDLFDDQGVIDGFNSFDDGLSTANLIRLGRDRTVQVWQVELAGEDIILEDAMVTTKDDVYAVGTIQDPQNPNHRQGFLVGFDGDGNQLMRKTFDAEQRGNEAYTDVIKNFVNVTELPNQNLMICGYDGGRFDGDNVSKAIFLEVTKDGDFVQSFSESVLTTNNVGAGFLYEGTNLTFIGNAFNNNSNSGAFITFTDFTSDVEDILAGPTYLMSFQNPTSDRLIINLPPAAKLESTVDVYNFRGQRVLSSSSTDMSVNHLAPGTYLVTAVVNGIKVTQKMVKL